MQALGISFRREQRKKRHGFLAGVVRRDHDVPVGLQRSTDETSEDEHGSLGRQPVVFAVVQSKEMCHDAAKLLTPQSPFKLVDHFGIGARSIVEAAKQITK